MLRLERISVEYATANGFFKAVDNVSFTVNEHETFALIGESGCGKTTLVLSILGLLSGTSRSGAAYFGGRNLFEMSRRELRHVLGREIGFVSQNPYHAFDPVYTIGTQIAEVLNTHLCLTSGESRKRVTDLLETVELDVRIAKYYPQELSGGMLQRAQLAAALCCRPQLIIADEPTSALDVTVQAQIIDLLNNLKTEKKLTLFIITHDLGVVAALADSVAVMSAGAITRLGTALDAQETVPHPITQ